MDKNDFFIQKATKTHSGKYNYSKVEYVNSHTKVCIICPEHGEFWQSPSNHLRGQGCPKCKGEQSSERQRRSLEEFINAARKVHGGKYDYSKVEYINNKIKVCIVCPIHGEFWQSPSNHLVGKGCKRCGTSEMVSKQSCDTENFISKAKFVHGNKYDYSKVQYVNNHTNVCIICPEHGEFWQMPTGHMHGNGCPICGKNQRIKKRTKNNVFFIGEAKKIHGFKYDYSKVDYLNCESKICIICPEHGEFWQTPSSHLSGHGCYKCMGGYRSDSEEFIKKCKTIHGENFDYSKVEYVNASTKVCIICPEHGEFWQTPHDHLRGCGCPKCKGLYKTTQEWIEEAKTIHKDKYNYSKVEYCDSHTKVPIICPIHGEFLQLSSNHLQGQGCPKCGLQMSKAEDEIIELLQPCNPQRRNRLLLKGKEIDIYLRDLKLGIEYNGLYWHSELYGKDHRYHIDKLNECNKQGIRLIQIFEDEWINHKDICISKLKQICGLNANPKIYARKCKIREIKNKKEGYEFLDKNHIQGQTGCTLALGAYYNEQLVAVMCFKKEKEGYWDLNRFASDINYQCIGLGGKMFKYFTDNYPYQEVKSFADRRWTTNTEDNLYIKLGFEFDSYVEPTYWYYNPNVDRFRRFHKFGFRKQKLHRQYSLSLTMTEHEMTTALGYTRIWDCGLIKFKYKKIAI